MEATLILGPVITCLLLALGHWFPWDFYLGQGLPKIAAYSYGSVSVLIGYAIGWGLQAAVNLGLLYIAAGATVCLCYVIDGLAKKIAIWRRSRYDGAQRPKGQ